MPSSPCLAVRHQPQQHITLWWLVERLQGGCSEQGSNHSHACEIRHGSGSDFYSKASKG